MKLIKKLFTLAAIALLITSCNKTDEFAPEQNSSFPADGVIRVATSVKAPKTRVGMTTEDLQDFQLRIINNNNSDYSYYPVMEKSGNKWDSFKFEYDELGKILPTLTPLTMLWQNKIQPVKVTALKATTYDQKKWDWKSNGPLYIAAFINQNLEDSINASDVLYMEEKVIDPTIDLVDGKIQIVLNHRLSKLNLTVKMGTEFNKTTEGTTTNPISNIKVIGTKRIAWWDLSDNTLSDLSHGYAMGGNDINPWHNAAAYKAGLGDTKQAEAKYECILIPQTVDADDFEVFFKIGTRYFSWISPAEVVLAADTQYNLTLNVGKDVVTVGGFTATPWTEADPQDLGTE